MEKVATKIDCCLNCDERHLGCHGHCEKYLKLRKQRDLELEENRRLLFTIWKNKKYKE